MIEFIPTICYECGEKLKITTGKNGKYKLVCDNKDCSGIAVRKFQRGMLSFEISGIGPAIFKKLYNVGIRDIAQLLVIDHQQLIDSGEFKEGRSLDKLIESIRFVDKIKLSSIVESLQFDNVGKTISKEVEKYYCGLPYDFSGFDYSIRKDIEDENSDMMVKLKSILESLSTIPGIEVIKPEIENTNKNNDMKIRIIEMTGSPKSFGFNTKQDFINVVAPFGIIAGTLNKDCSFLVTDDLDSKTSKMIKAEKLGVGIVTYGQLVDILNQ